MDKKEQIKSYWDRINKIEERIGELSGKGAGFSAEVQKRKSLLNNVKRLEKCLKQEQGEQHV
jgi:archaellum component FlaC